MNGIYSKSSIKEITTFTAKKLKRQTLKCKHFRKNVLKNNLKKKGQSPKSGHRGAASRGNTGNKEICHAF